MQSLIDRYEAAGPRLRQALAGLTDAECRTRIAPGQWSIHELVMHLQDSDAVAIDRMRRVIAEDNPPLAAFDETRFINNLQCAAQDRDDAATLFEVGRRQMARVLRCLPDAAFQRQGLHSEAGPLTLQRLLEGYVEHFEHHLRFLLQKRERLGKAFSPA